jgi:hypothetical protein
MKGPKMMTKEKADRRIYLLLLLAGMMLFVNGLSGLLLRLF